jgi:3-oxoacyl-[acyl-carrier protein] reductase
MQMSDVLKGKTAIITGGGRGIGSAIALSLSRQGVSLVLTGRSMTELEGIRDLIQKEGGRVVVFPTDISRYENVLALKTFTLQNVSTVDILINNAAGWLTGILEDAAVNEIEETIDTTIKGPIWMCKAFWKELCESKQGHIINITTMGVNPSRSKASPVYLAAKCGLSGFTEALRRYGIKENIRVTELLPGSVSSGIELDAPLEETSKEFGRSRYPVSDIAEAVIFALTRSPNAMVEEIAIPAVGDWAVDLRY